MPAVSSHAPGSFCWFELATNDPAAAKKFYGSLLGWTAEDVPMGPDGAYTLFKIDGRDAAAGYMLRKADLERHVPPHWMPYIAVADADAAAARAAKVGGTVIAPPFDVMDLGRVAVLQDPSTAMFCVWQPKRNPGTGVAQQNGACVWADLNSNNPVRASKFYEELFGWKIAAGKDMSPAGPDDYGHIVNGTDFIGGIAPRGTLPDGVPSHWLLYFQVADCDAAVGETTAAGGRVLMPATDMENVRKFAILSDPQGASFGVVQTYAR
jgi:hypothetical protein